MTGKPLKILVAHLDSPSGGNPDLPLLYSAVRAAGDVIVEPFSTFALLRERWDVVHIYWPEWCIRRDRGTAVMAADAARILTLLGSVRRRGTKVVWSLNNLRPHEVDGIGLVDGFLSAFTRLVDLVVCSSQSLLDEFLQEYSALRRVESRIIRPGSYRGVYPDDDVSTAEARTKLDLPADARILLSLGMVRRYKNILPLIRSYRELDPPDDTYLLIAGETLDQRFARRVRDECEGNESIRLDLRYIDDTEMQFYLRAADAMIVPASFASFSGSAMLALSFDCPVVVPHRGTFIEMRETLGPQWVRTFEGGVRGGVLRAAFDGRRPPGRPPLERHYEWSISGREHLRAYREIAGV
ncbi:glycosyltransferase family 4 protein [Nocardia terpenica]|uniref:glycosyltransferase n=1 Tax=Nocardia terpenica TaxID=455432 RepID=UPI00189623D2|nr:glycosyltransferase [Nocardia terpenica]MBF6063312.1 glycosyltransferase family 4 protein [Nocardia terpenica]MBF6105868.1 glycosyltransferase family 4 protein [Nocardia terpenica]MBF6113548.1 glycosyltransferase family 4 protein [Nocardia terpenica]MBF6119609.1 glycosyltransferase family 4 protein [Nocardia terpenica]MBF6152020.1 glycosyltransferase family 4 protein [Nocardia terpenica]